MIITERIREMLGSNQTLAAIFDWVLENKTALFWLCSGSVVVSIGHVLIKGGFYANVICNCFSWGFPLIASVTAREDIENSRENIKFWTIYWGNAFLPPSYRRFALYSKSGACVFAAMYWLMQRFCPPVDLIFAWIPNYYVVKFALIILVYFPRTKGLLVVYNFLRSQFCEICLGREKEIVSIEEDMKSWLVRFKYSIFHAPINILSSD